MCSRRGSGTKDLPREGRQPLDSSWGRFPLYVHDLPETVLTRKKTDTQVLKWPRQKVANLPKNKLKDEKQHCSGANKFVVASGGRAWRSSEGSAKNEKRPKKFQEARTSDVHEREIRQPSSRYHANGIFGYDYPSEVAKKEARQKTILTSYIPKGIVRNRNVATLKTYEGYVEPCNFVRFSLDNRNGTRGLGIWPRPPWSNEWAYWWVARHCAPHRWLLVVYVARQTHGNSDFSFVGGKSGEPSYVTG